MRTVMNYNALGTIQGREEQLKALHSALEVEFSAGQMALDAMGGKARGFGDLAKGGTGVKVFGAPARDAGLSLDAAKAALARKWAVPADNPELTDPASRVVDFFHANMPEMDLGWTNFFKLVDLRNSQSTQFEIVTTSAGISFSQKAPGEPTKIRRHIASEEITVRYLTFSDGIGILDDWFRFNQFWRVQEVVGEFMAQAWENQAQAHYSLITSIGNDINVSFATDDTTTFNAAAASIIRNARDKGYQAGQNAGLWIMCAPENLGRILRMLEATQGSMIVAHQANKEPLAYRVEGVVSTTHVASDAGHYYLILPERKLQRGLWKDLSIESKRDIYTRAEDWVGTQQFNAAVGDIQQVRRVAFA